MAQIIAIEEICEGMILAEPVSNKYGQVLLPAGTSLDEQKAKILKTWNIKAISVKGDVNEQEIEITQEMLDRCEEILLHKMNWFPKNHYETDMLKAAVYYLAKTLNNKEKD